MYDFPQPMNLTISSRKLSGLGRQATLVVFGDALTFASGIISAMVLARIISIEVMGTYRQIAYLAPMAVALSELGLSNSIYRFWNLLEHRKRTCYAKMVYLTSLVLGLLASLVLAGLASSLSRWYDNPDLYLALLFAAPFPLAALPIMLLRPILLSQGYSLQAIFLGTGFALLNIFSLVIPLWWGAQLTSALAVWIFTSLLFSLLTPLLLRKMLSQPGPWWDGTLFRQVWGYLWPIQVGRIPDNFCNYLDKVVMSFFLNVQSFAIYSLGARQIPFIGNVGVSVSNVMVPHLVQDSQSGRYAQICRRWRLACERTAMTTYLIAAFCVWHAVPVMQFLFSSTYVESSIPFRVFAAITFLRVVEFGSLAKVFDRTDLIMKAAFLNAGSLAVLAIPLVWVWGIFGMALTVLSGIFVVVAYYLASYRKLLGGAVASFFPWPRLLALLGIAFASTGVGDWLVGPVLLEGADTSMLTLGLHLGLRFAISGCLYGAMLLMMGFLKPESIIHKLKSWFEFSKRSRKFHA